MKALKKVIALLIAALALTMLASVISSTAKMITQSKRKMSDYYTANSELTTRSHDANNDLTDSGSLTMTVSCKTDDTYKPAKLVSQTESLGITYFANKVVSVRESDGGSSSVVAFWLTP